MHPRKKKPLVVVVGLILILAAWTPATAGDWEWEVAPYFWAPDVSVHASVRDRELADSTIDFAEILDRTDIAGLVHLEGHNGAHGVFVDLVYLSLSDDGRAGDDDRLPEGTKTRS